MNRWKNSLASCVAAAIAACGTGIASPPPSSESSMKNAQDETSIATSHVLDALEAGFMRKDVEGVVALFAPDATLESYLVTRVFKRQDGVCHGRAEIREIVRALMERGTPWGGHGPPLVRGGTMMVEFSSPSSAAEKFSVDVIEVRDGKIQSFRAYAGWRALAAGAARAE